MWTAIREIANQLLGEQLEDGGWNCEAPKGTYSRTFRNIERVLLIVYPGTQQVSMVWLSSTNLWSGKDAVHIALHSTSASESQ
jgi:hypothetical protein